MNVKEALLDKASLMLKHVFLKISSRVSLPYAEYRVAKTHWMPDVYRLFSAKEPYNEWLFGGKRPTT